MCFADWMEEKINTIIFIQKQLNNLDVFSKFWLSNILVLTIILFRKKLFC